jgi:hypothetical protein
MPNRGIGSELEAVCCRLHDARERHEAEQGSVKVFGVPSVYAHSSEADEAAFISDGETMNGGGVK